MINKIGKTAMVAALVAIGMSSAHAVTTTSNSLVVLDSSGFLAWGPFPMAFTWDGTYNTNVATAVVNASLVPTEGWDFVGSSWAIGDVRVYSAVNGASTTYNFTYPASTTYIQYGAGSNTVSVGAGQVAISMLFDWDGYIMPVVEVCEQGAFSASGYVDTKVWDCASVDSNGDGVRGIPIVAGAFQGFNFNVNLMGLTPPATVPVPAAVWLLGSGLLGLIGVARRKAV